MGWLWYRSENIIEGHRTKNGKWVAPKVDRKKEYESGINTEKYEVVKSVLKGNYYYSAVKILETGVVVPNYAILKTSKSYWENYGVKDIGGYSSGWYDVPISILKLLTPETDEEKEYIKKCYEYNEREKAKKTDQNALKNLPYGSIVHFTAWDGHTRTVIKCEPNHQFKTYWFAVNKIDGQRQYGDYYYPKKNIPDNYEVIRRGYEEEKTA